MHTTCNTPYTCVSALCMYALCALCVATGCQARQDNAYVNTLHQDQRLMHDGQSRIYHFYEAPTEDRRPLVILLHGAGGTIDNHIGLNGARSPHQVWLNVADESQLHLAIPQGIDKRWNDCRANCQRCSDADDIGFILSLIDDLAARYNIDRERVYAVGESNGGFMTQRLAQEAPDVFAGIGVTIALKSAQNKCDVKNQPMPIMYQVGTEDEIIPYEGGSSDPNIDVLSAKDTAGYWRTVNACGQSTRYTYPNTSTTDGSRAYRDDYQCALAPLAIITIDGGGHVASSSTTDVSKLWEGLVGKQNHDMESARAFWDFFEDANKTK